MLGNLATGQLAENTVGRYRLEAMLGQGGMGTVYRATCSDTGETVALKLINSELARDDESERRFVHEARAAREVEHRSLVALLDFGEHQGRRYIVMRYVAGQSLEQRLAAEGPLAITQLVSMTGQVARALDALHQAGVIHRDIKPGNILFELDGSAVLTDFGLAKGAGFSALTRPGAIVGTLDYLAPERIHGDEATAASDIYALGCVAYEALSGKPPFAGQGLFELAAEILGEDPPDPGAGRDDCSAELSQAILTALVKDPAERPPTATAYANLLTVAAGSA